MGQFESMVKFLDLSYPVKDEIVPCLIGPVGIGKTSAVLQHAKNVGAGNVVTIIASQILPNEVSGITMPDATTKAMEIYDHFRLSSLKDGDILFFDELLEADQLVLSACLTLIESRTMMSGKKLPDIQIIAATNPSIQPISLKENIRQRFLFKKFEWDQCEFREFILNKYGITLNETILKLVQTEGDNYNILSPRSLTKMVHWIMNVDEDDATKVSKVIDSVWHSGLGTELLSLRTKLYSKNKEEEVRSQRLERIKNMILSDIEGAEKLNFTGSLDEAKTFEEMLSVLHGSSDWENIKEHLEKLTVEDLFGDNTEVEDEEIGEF